MWFNSVQLLLILFQFNMIFFFLSPAFKVKNECVQSWMHIFFMNIEFLRIFTLIVNCFQCKILQIYKPLSVLTFSYKINLEGVFKMNILLNGRWILRLKSKFENYLLFSFNFLWKRNVIILVITWIYFYWIH